MKKLVCRLVIFAMCVQMAYVVNLRAVTTRYVSGVGSGTTCSNGSPCTLQYALSVMACGDITNMKGVDTTAPDSDGHYTGTSGMLIQPASLTCTAANRAVVQAVNDGAVWIDGQSVRQPLSLPYGGMDIEGINVYAATLAPGASVVNMDSKDNIFRRVVAWDTAADTNDHIWSTDGGMHFSTTNNINNLYEDVAGFGIGRKSWELFDSDCTSSRNIVRRGFFMWEASINTGPKRGIQTNYHSAGLMIDNAIIYIYSTIADNYPSGYSLYNDGVVMKVSPVPALCPTPTAGESLSSCPGGDKRAFPNCDCHYPGTSGTGKSQIASPIGWVGENEYSANSDTNHVNGNTVSHGVLIISDTANRYSCSSGSSTCKGALDATLYGNQLWDNTFIYIAPGIVDNTSGQLPLGVRVSSSASCPTCAPPVTALPSTLSNTTSIAGGSASDVTSPRVTVTNKLTGTSLAGVGLSITPNAAESFYNGTSGAKLRYRWVNGILTTDPLWPWPMGDRIKAATTFASTDGHHHPIIDINGNTTTTGLIPSNFGALEVGTATPTFTPTSGGPTATNTRTATRTPTTVPTAATTPGACKYVHPCHGRKLVLAEDCDLGVHQHNECLTPIPTWTPTFTPTP